MATVSSPSLVDALRLYRLLDPKQLEELKSLELPLKELNCGFKTDRDIGLLRSIKTLEKINGKTAREFWKEVEAKQKEKSQ
ncbi:MAG TPA: hypothetical protein VKE98_23940 [Gemmataceae bacterium]|nr:hypothetical protein [Gemmataceae bacterium]